MAFTPYYILDEHGEPVPVHDVVTWGRWFERAGKLGLRTVSKDRDEGDPANVVEISTVFLGVDHQFGLGPPMLWESLVFGGPLDGEMRRYSSREAALAGHQDLCRRVAAATES